MMSIIGCLLQRGPDLFYSDCFSAIFSADRRFLICFVADSHLLSAPWHLAVHLVFSSLRSIRPGCCMPSDSFMHSGFRFLLRFFSLAGKELLHCRGWYFPPSQKFGELAHLEGLRLVGARGAMGHTTVCRTTSFVVFPGSSLRPQLSPR
jgi:hypothetical protein